MAKNTTPALPVWIQDISLEDIGRRGGHAIHVYVHGYWGDVITIYVRREVDWAGYRAVGRTAGTVEELPANWTFEITHSSGGRSTDEVADSLESEAYFAQGLLAAVQHARLLRSQVEQLEKFYQDQARINTAREEAKKKADAEAKAKRIAEDILLGEKAAMDVVDQATTFAKQGYAGVIHAFELGAEEVTQRITASRGRDSVVRFTSRGAVIARAKLITLLAGMSSRTNATNDR